MHKRNRRFKAMELVPPEASRIEDSMVKEA